MPKVLILGATGMLGHVLFRELTARDGLDVYGTVRGSHLQSGGVPWQHDAHTISGVEATNFDSVRRALDQVRPDVVINCIGVIKQDPKVQDTAHTVEVNSLFPHLVARECADRQSRFIHVSTDCVFSGRVGKYREDSLPDPYDFYGRTKLVGEIAAPGLVLRTSIIGPELAGHRSLLDWFLSNDGDVRGFTRAIYSGVTTYEFAKMLTQVVLPQPELVGLWHVASEPINKHDLLKLIAEQYGWPGRITPDDNFVCDRSMSADKLRSFTGYRPPDWTTMIREMHQSSERWSNSLSANLVDSRRIR
jgi:dTDP-4-dehydrorhamnose reductase